MKGKKRLSAILVTVMLMISISIVVQFPVHASPGAKLIFLSRTWNVPIYDINKTALVPISINTTEKVYSWNVSFSYDPAILQYNFAIEGAFLKSNGTTTFTQGTPGTGTISYLRCHHNDPANYTQGTGTLQTLATLNFTILDYGRSALTFVQLNCELKNNLGATISPTFQDGYWETRSLVEIALPTYSWIYPVKKIGENFTMVLTINTVEKVTSWTTGIRFDNNTVKFISVTEGSFLSGNGTTNFVSGTDHNNGTVSGISCAHTANYTKGQGTPEVLATFKFQILALGKTAIDLTDLPGDLCETKVLDQNGDECSYLSLIDGSWELRTVVNVSLQNVYLTTETFSKGDTQSVTLNINTTETVHSWQCGVRFDKNVLNCTGVTYGTYITGVDLDYTINNTAGMVYGMGQSFLGGVSTTGAGILATIEFKLLDYGKTILDLTDVDLDPCEFLATDGKGDELTVLNLVDGSLEFRAGVSAKLSFIDPPYPSIGETLTLELRIYTIEDVTAWQSGLRFDKNVLNCTGVTYGTYITGVDLDYTINNTAGMVYGMGQSFLGGVSTTGNGLLATITFEVIGSGWEFVTLTDLDLDPTETIVTDQNGDECSWLQLVKGAKLKGDVNGNGVVESGDLIFGLGPAYGSFPGDANWNPNADFNCNGAVESGDLIFGLGPYYGTSYGGSDP
jgi:hypothetical protein